MGALGLSIAGTGLQAARDGMDAVAQNLANANTPGYVSEQAQITASPTTDPLGIGSGAYVNGIAQASDAVLAADNLAASASSASSSALQQTLSTVQAIFPEPGPNGLSSQLSTFWSSWDSIATNPSQIAPRTEVVNQAQDIASTLNQEYAQLSQTAANTNTQIASLASEVNTLFSQVASLNQSIVSSLASGSQPNALIDQRNNLVNQLGQDIGVTTRAQANGSLDVYVGGFAMVQGNTADSLTVTSSGSPSTTSLVSKLAGLAVPVSGGTMSGLLTAVNTKIPQYQSQLDTVATDLANTVNTQLGNGWDANANTDVPAGTGVGPNGSAPLFTIPTSTTGAAGSTGAAADIAVNAAVVANPQLLAAASSSTNGANDGSNAQAMAELGTSPTGPDQAYRNFITNLGSDVQTTTSQSQAQQSLSQSLQASYQSVVGVNTDQQTVDMLAYQQAYQASAKVVSTVDAMVQSLLAAT
ncbi:MAG: flagellar hook-associated protein FlgK [Actinomycetota bacterium]|jgi:flagellar hook-associated protein 1 FlgK|nr:flagellar hook-associated protein FlgK [Actinomycetota bacterium]